MADEARNGIPDVDKSPESTENESNEVKSSIVMRIDAPDSAPSVDPEPAAVSFSGARDFTTLARAFPSTCFPGRMFPSSNSTSRVFPGLPGGRGVAFPARPGPFGGGGFGGGGATTTAAATSPRPPLLRPSTLAVTSDVSSSEPDEGAGAEGRAEEREGEAATSSTSTTSTAATQMKFVPLGGAAPTNKEDSGAVSGASGGGVSSSVTGFVFGQNLRERAVAADAPDSTSASAAVDAPPALSGATSNGTAASEMLFTSVIQSEPPTQADSSGGGASGGGGAGNVAGGSGAGAGAAGGGEAKSLSEAAAEYEESRAVKRTYQRVALFTGEEEEDNVQQVNCKLFAYDSSTGQYVERGRGTLRLNDREGPDGTNSRVVMRTAGSLRVVLNTKVWAGMLVDRASPKSVRITAMEGPGQIKVFLVMASPKEIDGLCKSLQTRVAWRQAVEPAAKRGRTDDAEAADDQ